MNSQTKIVVGTIKRYYIPSTSENSWIAKLQKYDELSDSLKHTIATKIKHSLIGKTRHLCKIANIAARLADSFAKEAEKVVAVLHLDQEFGKNTLVYSKYHDMGTSRLLARMDSLISAVRNSSLSDPFSHVLTPVFE
tara:strand:+ start:170 stop:580 length:411 start_codon:yes stop_codon:yes gene_type:complete